MSTDEAAIVGDAHFVSEPSVSSASTWTSLHDALRTSTPSSAAKPTLFALETDKQASQPNKYKKLIEKLTGSLEVSEFESNSSI